MSDPKTIQFLNPIPAEVGILIYLLQESQGASDRFSVPYNGTVTPGIGGPGTWTVTATLAVPASGDGFTSAPFLLPDTPGAFTVKLAVEPAPSDADAPDVPAAPDAAASIFDGAAWAPVGAVQAPPARHRLAFTMQQQQQSNWCWAAVACSVAAYYRADPVPAQCDLANVFFGQSNCCEGAHGASGACNRPARLDEALRHVGCYGGDGGGRLPWGDVYATIALDHPLAVGIHWPDAHTGHAMCIVGYDDGSSSIPGPGGTPTIDVLDPHAGAFIVPSATFPGNIHPHADWTVTCYTRTPD